MAIHAWTEGQRIYVRAPYEYKDIMKSITGGRWDKRNKAWHYPRSYRTLAEIMKSLPGPIGLSEDLMKLLDEGDPYEQAAPIKEATDLPNPPICKGDDWLHQRRAYWWAKDLPAVLLDMWMGSGKTRTAINIVQNWYPEGNARVLIVCPPNVVPVWEEQIQQHAAIPWKVTLLPAGKPVPKRAEMAEQAWQDAEPGAITALVCNYEAVWRGALGEWVLSKEWDVVIGDELHHIKAPGSKQSLFFAKLHKRSKRRLGLTGTPLHDGPLDIYGQARFLCPEVFGTSFANFRSRYARMGGYGGYQILGYQNLDEFYEKYRSFTFSVGPDEALPDLPPIIFERRVCELSKEEQRVYASLENDFIAQIKGGYVTVSNALTKLLKLQQVTSGYVRDDDGVDRHVGDSKKQLLADVLSDLPKNEPVVIFCRFIHDLDAIHEVAKADGRKSFELSGRRRELEEWMNLEGGEVLAVQLKAGGEGVSMHRARYVIDYSLSFSLGEYNQTRSRLQRPGQTRQVISIALVAAGTVDEKIYKALKRKEKVIETILRGYGGDA
jgi:SNF2 family DNA or RNA helicase